MKKAIYAAVGTEEERTCLHEKIIAEFSGDPDIYSVYIDSEVRMDSLRRRYYKHMIVDVLSGKADAILIRSIEDLYMTKETAQDLFWRLKLRNIQVIIGTGEGNISTENISIDEVDEWVEVLFLQHPN